jgi:hypothetical protein
MISASTVSTILPLATEAQSLLKTNKNNNTDKSTTIQHDRLITSYRSIHRRSNIRTIIFGVESVVVLTVYLIAIWHWNFIALSLSQRVMMSLMGTTYFIRLNVMSTFLLQRELAIEELTFVMLVWIPIILSSFLLTANNLLVKTSPAPTITTWIILFLSTVLYLLGSFLNTYSELQRKWWKSRPGRQWKTVHWRPVFFLEKYQLLW